MTQIIVVGGGIVGVSTAYHLARAGAKVTLIDRQDAGQATDAAAGIIAPWISQRRNKAWYDLAKKGAAYYPSLVKALEAEGEKEIGYQQVGAIRLHTDEQKLKRTLERVEKRKVDAPEIGRVAYQTVSETVSKHPLIDASFSSVYVEGAARVDGRALRQALHRSALRHGARMIKGSATLQKEQGIIKGVMVNGHLITADQVILATGCWMNESLRALGEPLQIFTQKGQITHLHWSAEDETAHWPVVMPPNDQYIVSFEKGRVIVGTTHEDDQTDLQKTVGGIYEMLSKALEIAPALQRAAFVEVRVGLRPYTPNSLPIIGRLPSYPNVLLANGLGASGLTIGPFLGKQLAHLALAQEKEIDIDLSLYNIRNAR